MIHETNKTTYKTTRSFITIIIQSRNIWNSGELLAILYDDRSMTNPRNVFFSSFQERISTRLQKCHRWEVGRHNISNRWVGSRCACCLYGDSKKSSISGWHWQLVEWAMLCYDWGLWPVKKVSVLSGRTAVHTQEKQLDILGCLDAILLEVPLYEPAAGRGRPLLGRLSTPHDAHRVLTECGRNLVSLTFLRGQVCRLACARLCSPTLTATTSPHYRHPPARMSDADCRRHM